MIRNYILITFILAFSVSCHAQDSTHSKKNKNYNNRIKQFIGNFYTFDTRTYSYLVKQVGFYYERKVHRNVFLGVGYAQWHIPPLLYYNSLNTLDRLPVNVHEQRIQHFPEMAFGDLVSRYDYKMLDGYFFYKKTIQNRHSIDIGAGVSYCWGYNAYLKYFYQRTLSDATFDLESRAVHYWGFIPALSYNYLLFNNRMNIGVDLKVRTYSNRPKAQYDYGINIGFNF